MEYQIKYKELKQHLETLCDADFQKNGNVGLIEEGHSIDDIEYFKIDKSKIKLSQVINYGMPFLVDALGNDLSIVVLTKRKYKLPSGRAIKAKFDRTIIEDCHKLYGTALNGYWMIPDKFIEILNQ